MTSDVINPRPVESKPPPWGAIYAMSLCVFVLIASEFMPVSLLSPIPHDLHLTAGQAGQAISISGVFAFLASLLINMFIGEIDRRLVLLGMTALLIVSGTCVGVKGLCQETSPVRIKSMRVVEAGAEW
jgi:predicted MFS family arabinose efflux permease